MGKKRRRRRWSQVSISDNLKYLGLVVVASIFAGLVVMAYNRPAPVAADRAPRFQVMEEAEPTATPKKRAVFIGDSYTAGAGASDASKSFVTQVATATGWHATNLGRGGTGYLATSGKQGCGLDYCPNFREMIAEAVALKPSIVVVSGGRNDGRTPEALEQVRAFYSDLRTALPDAQIIATSPLWDSRQSPDYLASLGEVVRESVTSVGGNYIDIGQPLYARTDALIEDGVHPNDVGHALIAAAISTGIDAALPVR